MTLKRKAVRPFKTFRTWNQGPYGARVAIWKNETAGKGSFKLIVEKFAWSPVLKKMEYTTRFDVQDIPPLIVLLNQVMFWINDYRDKVEMPLYRLGGEAKPIDDSDLSF